MARKGAIFNTIAFVRRQTENIMSYFLIQIKDQIEEKMGQIEEDIGCIGCTDWTSHYEIAFSRPDLCLNHRRCDYFF
jgi:hypothetical protein